MITNIVAHAVSWRVVDMRLFKFHAWWFMCFHVMVVFVDMHGGP